MINVYDNVGLWLPMLIGFVLDAIIGDPHKLPHPIRLFGNCISFFEKILNKGSHRRAKGVVVGAVLVASTFLILYLIERLLSDYKIAFYAFNSIMFFYAISNRSLIEESYRVEKYLRIGDIPKARYYLSWIVGRDTENLSPSKIRISVMETMSENLSDGVIAPIFFYVIGGVPLMFAYKMINTLDSMIGYKNERFLDFGWFSARILDDSANFIPSRLTALLMFVCCPKRRVAKTILKFARCHTSPNSGYPESALAGILNCRFGGPNTYNGKIVDKPYIGSNERELDASDFRKTAITNISVSVLAIIISVTVFILIENCF